MPQGPSRADLVRALNKIIQTLNAEGEVILHLRADLKALEARVTALEAERLSLIAHAS